MIKQLVFIGDISSDKMKALEEFLPTWKSHEAKVETSYQVLDDCVLCLSVGEISGCSIDSLKEKIKSIDPNWLTPKFAYKKDDKYEYVKLSEAKYIVSDLDEDCLVINTMNDESLEIPLKDSAFNRWRN